MAATLHILARALQLLIEIVSLRGQGEGQVTITDHSVVAVVAAAVHIFAQRRDAQRSGATSPSLQEGACGLRKQATRNARNCITEAY